MNMAIKMANIVIFSSKKNITEFAFFINKKNAEERVKFILLSYR